MRYTHQEKLPTLSLGLLFVLFLVIDRNYTSSTNSAYIAYGIWGALVLLSLLSHYFNWKVGTRLIVQADSLEIPFLKAQIRRADVRQIRLREESTFLELEFQLAEHLPSVNRRFLTLVVQQGHTIRLRVMGSSEKAKTQNLLFALSHSGWIQLSESAG